MKKYPLVSIIIPVKKINDYIHESMDHILALDYPSFEILIFPDEIDRVHSWLRTRIIASGKVGPAEKRDLAEKYARGKVLAFLDDDAYPKPDWLKKMVHCFRDGEIGAVGGAAITPESDGILQKVSGAVFESYLGAGFARNRYLCIGDHSDCDDWPTVNLLVWKDVFLEVGGFDSSYWPGEDTKLCLDIINAGYKIKYDPEGVVYHHRRSDLLKHFKQIGSYALHRGYFAKRYPKTSLKLFYFVPTIFDLYLVVLLFSCVAAKLNRIQNTAGQSTVLILAIPLALYAISLIIDAVIISLRYRNPLVGVLTIPMIFLTHIWYGIRFVWGLILPELKR